MTEVCRKGGAAFEKERQSKRKGGGKEIPKGKDMGRTSPISQETKIIYHRNIQRKVSDTGRESLTKSKSTRNRQK